MCQACNHSHPTGSCPLKIAGVELCPLCGVAHYGIARQCPHIKSETRVKLMLDQLRNSPEDRQLVDAASKYLKGVKGHLVQNKKNARKQAEAKAKGLQYPSMLPIGSAVQTTIDQSQPAQVSNSGPSMYGQLEAARGSVKYPPVSQL
jgi:chromodomain-helicase-DNA-binding protein 4